MSSPELDIWAVFADFPRAEGAVTAPKRHRLAAPAQMQVERTPLKSRVRVAVEAIRPALNLRHRAHTPNQEAA